MISLQRALCALTLLAGWRWDGLAVESEPIDLARSYRIEQWKTDRGLPQNAVESLLQTRDGYLWVGTRSGLARFDGVRFARFDELTGPILRHLSFLALAEGPDGALWMGTKEGLLRWKDKQVTQYTTRDGLPHNTIWSLAIGRAGELWIGTQEGVSVRRDGKFVLAHPKRTDDVKADPSGGIWIWSEQNLWLWNAALNRFEAKYPALNDAHFCIDAKGVIWAGSHTGVHRIQNGVTTDYGSNEGLADKYAGIVFATSAGQVWANTQVDGLHVLQEGRFKRTHYKDVRAMLTDREGNIWIGTTSDGLSRLQPKWVKEYSAEGGLPGEEAWAVCAQLDGTVWIAAPRGLGRVRSGAFQSYPAERYGPLEYKSAVSLLPRKNGELWAGMRTGGAGAVRVEGGAFRMEFRTPDECVVGGLFEDSAGRVWMATSIGVFLREDGAWTPFEAGHNAFREVSAMSEDHAGVIWFGTKSAGLFRWAGQRLEAFVGNGRLAGSHVRCLRVDADGTLWVGTGGGLSRVRNGRVDKVTEQNGLFDNVVNSIVEDDFGSLWIGCGRGIYQASRAGLNAAANGRPDALRCVAYDEADGMLSGETQVGAGPGSFKAPDGRLWFATSKGAVVIDPKELLGKDVAPPVVIEKVRADGETVWGDGLMATHAPARKSAASEAPLRLAAGRARVLEIRYTANTFAAPEKVRFKYRLEGHDPDWLADNENRRVAFYTNLRPGDYRFAVKACNHHGVWGETATTFAFRVAPHFYETAPFYAVTALALLSGGFGLHSRRLGKLRRIEFLERQHALEIERARIAHDIHDDLGARLSQLSILQELAQRNLDGADFEKLRATTAEAFMALDEIVWAVNPSQDSLAGLISYLREYVPGFLSPAGIHVRLALPNPSPDCPLTAEARHDLFLIIKEALNNVVKHAGATEALVRIQFEGGILEVIVEDNGRGLLPVGTGQSVHGSDNGNGVANMRRRAAALPGDLTISERPGGGTLVRVSLRARTPPVLAGGKGEAGLRRSRPSSCAK